ncbi:MAG: hypothetical protein JXQ87_08245 [Bacteroidia bacterium]
MIRHFSLILFVASFFSAFAQTDTLSRQARLDEFAAAGLTYIDSLTSVYLNGSNAEKQDAALPLWCAFNRNAHMEKESFAPLNKIDSAELSAFIKSEFNGKDQLEKRMEYLLLSIPYSKLQEKVRIGKLDTNLFSENQKAVYYHQVARSINNGYKNAPDELVISANKAIHYANNNKQVAYIARGASHILGVYYFARGDIEKSLVYFKRRINADFNLNNSRVYYYKGYYLQQTSQVTWAQAYLDIGMCYEKLGNLIKGIDYYEKALSNLKQAKRAYPRGEYWAKSLLINSYFDFENSTRANKLIYNYLADLNKYSDEYERWRYLHTLFRELNIYDIEKSSAILNEHLFDMPNNRELFEPETVSRKPAYRTYIEQAGIITARAMAKRFGKQKLDLNKIEASMDRLIFLHNKNVIDSKSKDRTLKTLECIQSAWKMASQNDKELAKSQNRLKALFANEDSLHYFAYNAKLCTYILKLNGQHAQEIELLQLLKPRYIKGNYVVELQKLYWQLSEANEAIGNVNQSLIYFKRSDSLKQQTQQLNQAAQLALFDKKLEVSKTITEKKLLETENQALKARRNLLTILVILSVLVICLVVLLFFAKRKRHKLLVNQKQLQLQLLEKDVSDKNTQLENTTLQLLKSNNSFAKLFEEMNQLSTSLNAENKKKARSALLEHKSVLEVDIWEQFKLQFQKTNAAFFTKLKELDANLTETELRICAMHVSNLSSKEIAAITGQQIRSIYTLKSRIRKKLDVQDDVELLERLKGVGVNGKLKK